MPSITLKLSTGYQLMACAFLFLFSLNTNANLRIAWFVPVDLDNQQILFGEGNEFWKFTNKFSMKAAGDLGVELVLVDYNRNRFEFVERAQEVASGKYGKIDGVIFHNFLNKGGQVLDILERAQIPSISIITNFIQQDTSQSGSLPSVGRPRGLFKYWLAEFKTDDEKVGRELMHYLARLHQQKHPKTHVQKNEIIAIAGERAHSASMLRKQGLFDALEQLHSFELAQLIEGSWSRKRAKEVLPKLLKRHGDVKIIWCANDELAMGVIDGLLDAKLDPKNYIIGGVDWNLEALNAIELQQLKVSFGGHFMQGAYALVLMYDYLNGVDFANDYGVSFELNLQQADKMTIHLYKNNGQYFSLDRFNFHKMSRYHQNLHQRATDYSFNYLDQLTVNAGQH